MSVHPVLVGGHWRDADASEVFSPLDPATGQRHADSYPVSTWADITEALAAAAEAAEALRRAPVEAIAKFLRAYADRIEASADAIADMAHRETALPKSPRLKDVELPRTTNQLRQAADAAVEGSWSLPTIDTKLNIRSHYAPIGPVCVMGPNNFPFAFNGISGGDFAAAIAAGNPVIAKGHPSHPGTTRLLAEQAHEALRETNLHPASVQLLYHIDREDGLRLVSDPRIGASAFTGSRSGGLALKAAADAAGKPIYLEMSSVNPLLILPGALDERGDKLADEFADSALLGSGQFCTNPGLVILLAGDACERFTDAVRQRFESRPPGPLLADAVLESLAKNVNTLVESGAKRVTRDAEPPPRRFANTLLRVDGDRFLEDPRALQTEAFGNASLIVAARDPEQMLRIVESLEGNLTGCIYSATGGSDDALYEKLAPSLRRRVGRLLNDKMPTGVAVSPAMHHGGPYPSTGHPGFTAVGIPASLRRFAMLQCYDQVRESRLPVILRDSISTLTWRLIDGQWKRG